MAQNTSIEWTDATWNPVHGCSKVSPGCAHCYAETLSLRYGHTSKPWTPGNAAENVILKPHKLREPLSWREPRMVFVNSMSDLFHELVPDDYIARVFVTMALSPRHTFQVLTKRPDRMKKLLGGAWIQNEIDSWLGWDGPCEYPLPNVWLGTSIENRRFVHRADLLRETAAAVRFISAEPLLGPLLPRIGGTFDEPVAWWPDGRDTPCVPYDGLDLHEIDWLIVGGESGPGHRPMNEEWVYDLRDACEALDVAFFVKQLGGARPGTRMEDLPYQLQIRDFPRVPERAA